MTTFAPTYDQFKVIVRDFLVAAPTATLEELEAGMKCVGLHYLGIKFEDSFFGTLHRDAEAPALMRMSTKAFIARELDLLVIDALPKPCCANENRSFAGGCLSCGDPSF